MPAPVIDRVRAFVGERTGLSRESIDAVLQACADFWAQYPELAAEAEHLAQRANESHKEVPG